MSKYYTIKGKSDGFGAQYQAILSGIAYCNYKKYIYVHTPFTEMQHGADIIKANEFIGINTNSLPYDISRKIVEKRYEKKVHKSKSPSKYYTSEVIEYIRNCYFSSKKPLIDNIDIAIHIRRGDVNVKNKIRYASNRVYLKIIKKLKKKYPEYTITIFSEGKYEDFKDLGLAENNFKLNTDIFETFHSLVSSKVLIQGLSSFSYCAGIINNNTVYYYDTLWHNKLNHWLKISDLIGNLKD